MSLNNINHTEEDDNGIYFYPDESDQANDDNIDDELSSESYEAERYDNSNSNETRTKKTGSGTVLSEILSYVKIILCAVAIAFVFKEFIIVNAQVPSGSMNNTINTWDRLIGFRLSYMFSSPKRGDIVIFKYPDDETASYVKRVIGLPGDVIEIKDGHVTVNGEVLEEDYIKEDMITDKDQVYVVPEDCYFMMGDNRNNSLDSRYWVNKYVAKDKILAKVIFRYYNGNTKRVSLGMIK